ncbi:acetyl-CoA C-acetyltransferase [Pseudoalteromonas espejiana DSM 9414]|uniref:Thiolase n=1 Tax=Pseudoalteromonas espejiana TaxID=28107 RepID=A0A510XU03_9GAMM|nr:beta-ketothiolase BktB [Pseudoalteromonas espejiana]ASM49939.1 acetyl-CoA C-acetyltransferase [Pseudoalteromonas espejiana DSM 9414]GEK54520.1 thiolase [Pseudoalteromonas espejiana]
MTELTGNSVVILSAVRSPIGSFGGSLKNFTPAELGTLCAKEAIIRAKLSPTQIDSCIVGKVIHNGPKDAYLSRVIGLDAGLPINSHAVTLNRLCGSGLEAIIQAAQQIQLGDVDTVLAGGAESMSSTSYTLDSNRWGQKMGNSTLIDELTTTLQDPWDNNPMGITAENIATKYAISREEQDSYAALSHHKAAKAIAAGHFKDQIIPVDIKSRKNSYIFDTDEHVRADTTLEKLAMLKPHFKTDGIVTAATSSGINDGAAMLVLMNEQKAVAQNLKPLGRLIAYARVGVEPSLMGIGPIPAVQEVLRKTGLSVDDMDVIESNEAFAVQALCVANELSFPQHKVNPNGGAIALGHPVGATGAILSTKCLYELKRINGKYGLVTMCIGGGQGIAAIYEAL